jgi:two-component sensor histidine kinase/ligand-binding sensor protein
LERQRELLDPEGWTQVLELYSQAMQVAVAMTDDKGRLLGACHNPQPIWSLARDPKSDTAARCIFCLHSNEAEGAGCTAAADAHRTGSVVLVHDPAGLAHVAVPLVLGDRHYGTLLAGQVFDRDPEPAGVKWAAKEFGLSEQMLRDAAARQVPMNRTNLGMYGSLLLALGQAVLGQRHSSILKRKLFVSDTELQSVNQELQAANAQLELKVAELSKSNGEKSVLLQEVHHRVNNNLQVIASLLRMQAESFGDNQLAEALRTSQHRIESMALIHAQLYDATDLRHVDFAEYCERLAENLLMSYGVDRDRIALSVKMGGVTLSVDQAIPAGLILGELITNAIKYAFPDGRRGSIRLEGGHDQKRVSLALIDDGVGFDQARHGTSRGLNIVSILCKQLRATSEQTRGPGVVFRMTFPTS